MYGRWGIGGCDRFRRMLLRGYPYGPLLAVNRTVAEDHAQGEGELSLTHSQVEPFRGDADAPGVADAATHEATFQKFATHLQVDFAEDALVQGGGIKSRSG